MNRKQKQYPIDYSCIVEPENGKGGLYIGNLEAASSITTLAKHSIKAVLTTAKGVHLKHSPSDVAHYKQISAEDHEQFNLSEFFEQAAHFINECLKKTNIMVHCLAGVSRSVSLVIAFFIKFLKFTYQEAFSIVKIKRKIIHPNEGFIQQLKQYEKKIHNKPITRSPSTNANNHPSNHRQQQIYSATSKTLAYTIPSDVQQMTIINRKRREHSYYSPSKNPQLYLMSSGQQSGQKGYQNKDYDCRMDRNNTAYPPYYTKHALQTDNVLKVGHQSMQKRRENQPNIIYSPLQNTQHHRKGQVFSNYSNKMADIDQKINEIRKKYSEYGAIPHSKYDKYINLRRDQNSTAQYEHRKRDIQTTENFDARSLKRLSAYKY